MGWTSTKLKDHNAVMLVRLEPAALRSQVKHSTSEPLHSLCKELIWLSLLTGECDVKKFTVFIYLGHTI